VCRIVDLSWFTSQDLLYFVPAFIVKFSKEKILIKAHNKNLEGSLRVLDVGEKRRPDSFDVL
jgi:hypothetical protein